MRESIPSHQDLKVMDTIRSRRIIATAIKPRGTAPPQCRLGMLSSYCMKKCFAQGAFWDSRLVDRRPVSGKVVLKHPKRGATGTQNGIKS